MENHIAIRIESRRHKRPHDDEVLRSDLVSAVSVERLFVGLTELADDLVHVLEPAVTGLIF